jgi:hypothetical protein
MTFDFSLLLSDLSALCPVRVHFQALTWERGRPARTGRTSANSILRPGRSGRDARAPR